MNRVFAGLVGLVVAATCEASLILAIPLPYDDRDAKVALWSDPALKEDVAADRQFYWTLEERLRTLSEERLAELFGPSQATLPPLFVLPVHHHSSVGFSGRGYRGDGRLYFLSISNLGGLLVFPYGDGKFVSSVALYLKADPGFIPLHRRSDYLQRRAWELQRREMLRTYVEGILSEP